MRAIIFLFIAIMICGCSVIVDEGDDVRIYGANKEEGVDTLERIENTPDAAKHEIKWFERKEKE